jgi:predicted RNase H-like nuclease (RuvC/YqgF family)
MKRPLVFAGLLITLTLPSAFSQDNPAAAAAAREEAEARYQRLNSRIEDLEIAFQRFKKDQDRLESEVRAIREQVTRAGENTQNAATQESLKRLADAIEEVDKKRLKDQEKVDTGLKHLEKLITSSGAPKRNGGTTRPPVQPPKTSGKGYEYSIQDGDTLSVIVAAIREQKGLKLTQKQVMDANPGVNWNRLQIGQKIFIPDPSQP